MLQSMGGQRVTNDLVTKQHYSKKDTNQDLHREETEAEA